MRWKLLVITSFAAAFLGFSLWSGVAIGLFGNARSLGRHDWLLLSSAIGPLAIAAFAGFFLYRHAARRRKTHAVVTTLLTLLLTAGVYLVASQLFPDKLIIPRTYEVRHAR